MEKLQIVCPTTGNPLGTHLDRAEVIASRAWCRSTNVYVLNAKGQVLCHRRSSVKERHPGAWSTHLGGHVTEGESFVTNAQKELEEESGLAIAAAELLPWRTTKLASACLWIGEFVVFSDKSVGELVPQPGEVDEFAWLAPDEIIRRSEQGGWLAGTHDFVVEYQCMRAVLNAAHGMGSIRLPDALHAWGPGMAQL